MFMWSSRLVVSYKIGSTVTGGVGREWITEGSGDSLTSLRSSSPSRTTAMPWHLLQQLSLGSIKVVKGCVEKLHL